MEKIECFAYWPVSSRVTEADVKSKLPHHLRDALMKGSRLSDFGIYIDAAKTAVVGKLDRFFGICTRREFVKTHVLEVGSDSIRDYEYFHIMPRDLEDGKDVFFDMSRPTCSFAETCPWGARITSP